MVSVERAGRKPLHNLATVRSRVDALQTLAAELAALVRQCDPKCATGCGTDCVLL